LLTKTFKILITIIFIFIFISCEDKIEYDAQVNIISVVTEAISQPYESKITRFAKVSYTINNTCECTIHGWEIYFNVAINGGPNVTAMDNRYYTLEAGETSKTQIASTPIPSYYEDARNASLKNLEMW
jgi:hypothetical protein